MRGQLTGREWLGRAGGAPTTAEPADRVGSPMWRPWLWVRGSIHHPTAGALCDQGAAFMLATSQKRSVHRLPDGHVLEHPRLYLPLSSGHPLVGTGLAPGGFAGMACL
jgi:hypothetical protein